MRRAILPTLLLALALALPATADAATKQERICAKRGDTVARSATARVFEVNRSDEHTLYACLRRGGKLQPLASWFSCECSVGDDPAPAAELLAGHFVAVTHYPSCGPFPCEATTTYTLRNLRSRRDIAPQDDVWQVVTGPGFFAYEDGRVVRVRGGEERVVDAGPGIEHFSLAVAGRRLYWMRDGVPQSVAD
jgi:hypothetical protein